MTLTRLVAGIGQRHPTTTRWTYVSGPPDRQTLTDDHTCHLLLVPADS
jgi:hypothetical protein